MTDFVTVDSPIDRSIASEARAAQVARAPTPAARGSSRRLGAPAKNSTGENVVFFDDIRGRTGLLPCEELDISFDAQERALWCYMKPKGPPSYTLSMLEEINQLHAWLNKPGLALEAHAPLFYVLGSRLGNVYNLGGDLAHFVESIRTGNRDALIRYAFSCVQAVHSVYAGFASPIISIGLVQGDALGGGLEGALSFNVLVAERGVKMGFPEVLFGLFPGMGAYSLLSRKIGAKAAERMIIDGRLYRAEEFYEMGIVDILAPVGEGERAVHTWIGENRSRQRLLDTMNKVRQRTNPLLLDELQDITLLWVDAAMALDPVDLRRMERLVAAQRRSARTLVPSA